MIVLVGFMGAGKTTVGHLLSAHLGLPFVDSDLVIEQRSGRPARQIFAEDGEPAFRALEHEVIAGLLDGPDLVLAVGGGAAEHPGTRALLARGDDRADLAACGGSAGLAACGDGPRPPREGIAAAQVVYLEVGYDQAMVRVGGDPDRPLLARPDLAATYQRRLSLYAGIATLTVSTDGRHPETVSQDIVARLITEPAAGGRAPHRPSRP